MVQHFSIDNSIEIVQLLGLNLDSSAVDFSFLLATTCAVIVLTSVVPTRLKGTLHAIAGELSKILSASMRCIYLSICSNRAFCLICWACFGSM